MSETIAAVTKMDDDYGYTINVTAIAGLIGVVKICFDTGPGTYPSIFGTHNGTITPNQTITVSKLYTYPCPGTGGHTEFVRIWGNGVNVSGS